MTEFVRLQTGREFIDINSVTGRLGKSPASGRVPDGNLIPVCRAVFVLESGPTFNRKVTLALASGNRNRTSGALNNVGSNGYYWSSAPSGTNARNLNFNSSNVNPLNDNNRANGFPVRCV